MIQTMVLADKELKAAIIIRLKEVKGTTVLIEKVKNLSREIEMLKEEPNENSSIEKYI